MRRICLGRSLRTLLVPSLFSLLVLTSSAVQLRAQDSPANQPQQVEPQIVRLSLSQGDVRIMRGDDGKKVSGAEWQQAETGTPLEGGFSLVTGTDGRAEIEFEDTSVAYLAPNSVLMFDQLAARGDTAYSHMQLLSGSISLRLRPLHARDSYVLVTPQDMMSWDATHPTYMRVDSFLDTTVLTSLDNNLQFRHADGKLETLKNASLYLRNQSDATSKPTTMTGDKLRSDEWDQWVATRLAARDQAMSAMMQQAGLKEPVPGLADMAGQGHFFDCEPYGKCWEPNNGWDGKQTGANQTAAHATRYGRGSAQPHLVLAGFTGQSSFLPLDADEDEIFPCSPYAVRSRYRIDTLTGQRIPVSDGNLATGRGRYNWAVCHTGSWIHTRHHYSWVSGNRHHHHCPVRWVANGGHKGFVPLHPLDKPGKEPLNLKHGLYETKGWKQGDVEHVAYEPNKSVKVLAAPKEFATLPMPKLAAAEAPRPTTHAFFPSSVAKDVSNHGELRAENKDVQTNKPVAMRFDHSSQSFSLERQEMHDGKMRTVSAPISNGNHNVGSSMASRGGSSSISTAGGGIRGGSSGGGAGAGSAHSSGGSMSAGSGGGASHSSSGGGGGGGGGASSSAGSHK